MCVGKRGGVPDPKIRVCKGSDKLGIVGWSETVPESEGPPHFLVNCLLGHIVTDEGSDLSTDAKEVDILPLLRWRSS